MVLRRSGISQTSVRAVVDYLRNREGLSASEVLSQTTLVTDGSDVYEIHGEFTSSVLRKPGQLSFTLVQLDQLVSEIQEKAALTERAA